MAFADTIRGLPFASRTQTASGFFPPLFRAAGHILYLLGCLAADNVEVLVEEALTELRHAQEHWNARATTPALSAQATERATAIGTAIGEALAEFEGWEPDARIQNLRDLANRIAQYAADLDRELTGIRDSDPGSSL